MLESQLSILVQIFDFFKSMEPWQFMPLGDINICSFWIDFFIFIFCYCYYFQNVPFYFISIALDMHCQKKTIFGACVVCELFPLTILYLLMACGWSPLSTGIVSAACLENSNFKDRTNTSVLGHSCAHIQLYTVPKHLRIKSLFEWVFYRWIIMNK